jgi:lipoprotein-anchoring transpeptidase ErfK/SrfK
VTARSRTSRAALALAVPAVLAGLSACSGSPSGYAPDPPPPTYGPGTQRVLSDDYGVAAPPSQPPASSKVTAEAPPPTSAATQAPAATAAFDGLKPGDSGPQVKALQEKLQSLHFWVGSTDGNYGLTTTQAVIAVQKAAGITADGVMGKQTRQALAQGVSVSPESSHGHVIEINKSKQLALVVQDGRIEQIFHTSTGSGQTYTSEGQTSVANTPAGHFTMFRQVNALDKSPLGELWRPKYFNGGIALHGDGSVPPYPASHGCARISNPAIDWIWANNEAPMGTSVWVY